MTNSQILVGDCIQTLRQKHKIKKSEYLPSGTIPVVDQGQNFIAGYIEDTERAYDGQLPVIVFGDHTCTLKYVDFPFAVGAEGTQLIRPTADFDIRYFYYALQDLPLEHFGYQRHFKYLKTSKILCPPMQSQHKIAAVLSAYDDLIENNTRRIKILEDMAQTLYQEWFVHFRFPGHESVPMVESALGPIPQGWEIGKFGDIVENVKEKVTPGKHLSHLSYVPIDCIPRRSISLVEQKSSSEAKSSLVAFKRNDILFGAMRSYFHKVILSPFDGITRQTCFVLRSKNSNNYPFNLFTTFQDSTVDYSSNHSTGSTIPYATWDLGLALMPIIIPPTLLIKQFSDTVIPLLDSILVMLEKNTNLRQTRDLLLPKLISGEIDVSELDIDTDPKSN